MGKKRNKNNENKRKISLVFDETKRKDFLCGFRKRKLERKKKAQEDLQRMLKEEKRRIKQENKESYKKLVVSSRPIPDIEQLLQEEYEDEDVNVKIVELSSDTLQKKDIVIGENRPKEAVEKKVKAKMKVDLSKEILGMASSEQNESEAAESEEEDNDENLKSKKDVKKILKKQATKKLQKSKVFQMKTKLDRIQNKKTHKKKAKTDQRKEKSKKKNHRKIKN
ncbi:nucleolar protein 12 [Vanessa atalanta]|uniref:nucleolar protein 12 n=1 Tax=Vanessa atalanta TaxID=42275 RepID=UPI001FCCE5B9|nr:nucleolar protein 12 [Vanessa atalanta]